jgi:hypothetical protein
MNALKKVLSKIFKDDFKPFKTDNNLELPNRADFSGDKAPSKTGDPAKIEVKDWHEGNTKFKNYRNKEKKDDYTSLIATPEGRQEKMKEAIARQGKWFTKIANIIDKPEDAVPMTNDTPSPNIGEGIPEKLPKENTIANKINWREILAAAEPDINLKRKPDGTLELNVMHPSGIDNADDTYAEQPTATSDTTVPPTNMESTQQAEQTPVTSSIHKQACKESAEEVNEWIIRKEGSYVLLGRECKDKAGIFILNFPKDALAKSANLQDKLAFSVDKEIHEKNGHTWRELISQGLWETKFDNLIKK